MSSQNGAQPGAQPGANSERRVVVTGMGAITSLGTDVETLWQNILDGRSGVRHIQQFDSQSFPVRIGSEVDADTVPVTGVPESLLPLVSRTVQFGCAAFDQAWADAGLHEGQYDPWRAGVCVGAYNFPMLVADDDFIADPAFVLDGDHYHAEHYIEFCRTMPSVLSQRDIGIVSTMLAMRQPLYGLSMTVQTACASATQALGEAFQMIRHGEADLMVTGGTDSLLTAVCVTGFTLIGVVSAHAGDPAEACRPFDAKRDGLVLGEGAGIVVLEELEHARQRGAKIYGEVIGYGSSCDGFRFTDSHPEGYGPINAMRAALTDARIEPEAVDYVNAHGTATRQNDRTETLAIKRVFGEHAYKLAVSSTKSELGHLICAAGGVEFVISMLALSRSTIPPTINLHNPDPACDLDYVPFEPRRADLRVAISNSFGFGGQNGTLVMRRWSENEL